MAVLNAPIAALESFRSAEDAGLDPKLYIGTFEADLMVGGVVSGNRTLYPADDVVSANESLRVAIAEGNVAPGEEGHASVLDGPSFKLPVMLQTVEMVHPRRGVVEVSGTFALTNTPSGHNIDVLRQIGVPIGVSLNGFVQQEQHTIDRKSPFYEANKAHAGEQIALNRQLSFNALSPYDLVRMPSFDTFVEGPATESIQVREALAGLADILKDPTSAQEADTNHQEPKMDLQKKIDELEASLAEVRESSAKAVEAAETKAAELTEANGNVAKALEASTAINADLKAKAQVAAEAAAAAEDKDAAAEIAGLKAAAEADRQAHAETQKALEQLQADRDAEKLGAQIAEAAKTASEGDHQELVLESLTDLVTQGLIVSVEQVAPHATRIRAVCSRAAEKPTGEAKVSPMDAGTDTDRLPTPVSASESALSDGFKAMMNRGRTPPKTAAEGAN
jgi:hypothetical protein